MHLGVSHKNSIACLRARSFPPPPVNVERGRTSRQFLIHSAADFPISSWPHSNTCSPPRATSTALSVTSIRWLAEALEFQMSTGSAHLDSALTDACRLCRHGWRTSVQLEPLQPLRECSKRVLHEYRSKAVEIVGGQVVPSRRRSIRLLSASSCNSVPHPPWPPRHDRPRGSSESNRRASPAAPCAI